MRASTWMILGIAVVGSFVLLVIADQGSHSVSDTLYQWVVPVALLWLGAGIAVAIVRGRRGR